MRRREFITLVGGAAVGWPLAARAQQPGKPVIGFLGAQTPELFAGRLRAFRQGLTESGYIEGRNVAVEYRWAQGKDDRLPILAADLVRRQVAVIATSSTSSSVAARAATKTIPIVFGVSSDPVQLGLVESLNRPGGNATGSTNLGVEAGPKRLELLHDLLPTAKVMAFLIHPANPGAESQTNEHQRAARTLGLQLHVLRASTEADIDSVLATLTQLGVPCNHQASSSWSSTSGPLKPSASGCSPRCSPPPTRSSNKGAFLLRCMSPQLCRFSDAGNDGLTTRSGGRRPKSAKARNRVGR
jgi:putative ABC transport system substrate-binding protein